MPTYRAGMTNAGNWTHSTQSPRLLQHHCTLVYVRNGACMEKTLNNLTYYTELVDKV